MKDWQQGKNHRGGERHKIATGRIIREWKFSPNRLHLQSINISKHSHIVDLSIYLASNKAEMASNGAPELSSALGRLLQAFIVAMLITCMQQDLSSTKLEKQLAKVSVSLLPRSLNVGPGSWRKDRSFMLRKPKQIYVTL